MVARSRDTSDLDGVVLAACGSSANTPVDAAPPDAPPDAPASYPACHEFATLGITVPAHAHRHARRRRPASRPSSCAEIDAPFGIESAGPDSVLQVSGLVPEHDVRRAVTSARRPRVLRRHRLLDADRPEQRAVPAVRGCEHRHRRGRPLRRARHDRVRRRRLLRVAPAEPTCRSRSTSIPRRARRRRSARGATPVVRRRPVRRSARSSFDCTDAGRVALRRHATHVRRRHRSVHDRRRRRARTTTAPPARPCSSPTATASRSTSGLICSQPADRGRLPRVRRRPRSARPGTSSSRGRGTRDLDLEVVDATGSSARAVVLGAPRARAPDVPPARPLLRARQRVLVQPRSDRRSRYTRDVAAHRSAPAARRASDCAAEYRNQLFRGDCVAGACVAIAGNGAVAEGGACDSQSDCAAGLSCPSFFFVAERRHARGLRARPAATDSDCARSASDYMCTTYLAAQLLRPEVHERPAVPDRRSGPSRPAGPWYRLTLSARRPAAACRRPPHRYNVRAGSPNARPRSSSSRTTPRCATCLTEELVRRRVHRARRRRRRGRARARARRAVRSDHHRPAHARDGRLRSDPRRDARCPSRRTS